MLLVVNVQIGTVLNSILEHDDGISEMVRLTAVFCDASAVFNSKFTGPWPLIEILYICTIKYES